ncbi:hypothetical protein PLEOSDRAFT_1090148 [Pleurotus ostreatus PC15]|uniref:Uncharacterized protein n=1 Tax=Pleurotus ostreatus (strain PC15) TaxID=1137138 RepID=A0A067NFQ5_PLEO1|nr:hypothetical protein PLEOSDRAFT_1090148 [Pleurotus ostreatus PC15]
MLVQDTFSRMSLHHDVPFNRQYILRTVGRVVSQTYLCSKRLILLRVYGLLLGATSRQ